jgi:hypothetical protein
MKIDVPDHEVPFLWMYCFIGFDPFNKRLIPKYSMQFL